MDHVVVVGASVAGLRAAEVLRSRGFDGLLTVVDADPHTPYDKPPLSKRILTGELEPDAIALRKPEMLEQLRLDLRLGIRATALDPQRRRITVGGETLAYDGLIVATGSAARRVPAWDGLEGVQTLRTLDDALTLRAGFERSPRRVVVIGAGFIGLEVAASAVHLGLQVTVIEPMAAPVVRGVGAQLGSMVADMHRAHGVDLRLGVGVEALVGVDRVESVHLTDSTVIEADVVVVGVGATPVTDWLADSGLSVRDGIVCDATLMAAPGVFAAGDVARWPHGQLGSEVRIEHWTNAAETGVIAAENLLAWSVDGERRVAGDVPFFWSDQYQGRIQVLGRAGPDDTVHVVRGPDHAGKVLALYSSGDQLTAAFGYSLPKPLMSFRPLLARRATLTEALEHAATLP
jgi:NADPH-dependent 2,4-dienoyl-CoA reductase/sulfur reductase-like enzyme